MKDKYKGSITVEASVVFPIVIFVCMAFIYVLEIAGFEKQLYDAMYESADTVAKYAYCYDKFAGDKAEKSLEKKGKAIFATANVYTELYDKVDSKIVIGSIAGISLLRSEIGKENDEIKLVADYVVRIPFPLKNIFIYKQTSTVYTRMFVGKGYSIDESQGEDDEEYVYVTTNGKVYHTNQNCTYIKIKIEQVDMSDIETIRNSNGGKYYQCARCSTKKVEQGKVYVTKYGNRYHSKLDCSEIKRSVRKVKKSTVKEMKECAKCAANK